MTDPTDRALRAVLLDPDTPWAVNLSRSGNRVIYEGALLDHVRRKLGDTPDLETRVHRFLDQIGGERLQEARPLHAFRRVFGLRTKPPEYVFEIPAAFFGEDSRSIADQYRRALRSRSAGD